ncbi:MAG: AMP-binding protein [Peptostreptococcaceae bacterium]|nr:AMP-binding protein [Peptostreptococcaceae bacterium]
MLNKEVYTKMKQADMDYAVKRANELNTSKDPRVMYKNSRPIMNIKHMLETSAELFPENIAFMDKEVKGGPYLNITYKEMLEKVNGLGTALIAHGLKNKKIAVIGENSYRWGISYLAAVCGAGVVVPLDKELSPNEIKQLIIEAEVSCVLYDGKFEEDFLKMKASGQTNIKVLVNMQSKENASASYSFDELVEEGVKFMSEENKDFLDAQIIRDEMSMLLFTSGTTGVSKGVMLSHGNIVEELMTAPTLLEIRPTDIFFSILPMHHTYECTCGFLLPLYKGSAIAYCEGLKYIVKNLSEVRPTMLLAVPLILESLYKKIWQNAKKSGKEKMLKKVIAINRKTKKIGIDLGPVFMKKITDLFGGRMRIIICGGAAINPDILQGINDFGITALQGYGLTECSPICALNPDKFFKNDSLGYVPPGFDAKIIDMDPETRIGEICVKGGNVMLGYYKMPEESAKVLVDGWLHTGDLGYIDKDNYIYLTGRIKNVIITKNGKNVYPEEIEYYLSNVPYIKECMVMGIESKSSDEILITASIFPDMEEVTEVLGNNPDKKAQEFLIWTEIDKINKEMPYFKRIKKISIRSEEFEKTTGKKIKRNLEENKV